MSCSLKSWKSTEINRRKDHISGRFTSPRSTFHKSYVLPGLRIATNTLKVYNVAHWQGLSDNVAINTGKGAKLHLLHVFGAMFVDQGEWGH